MERMRKRWREKRDKGGGKQMKGEADSGRERQREIEKERKTKGMEERKRI